MTSDPRLTARPGLKQAILDRLKLSLGILPENAKPEDWFSATSQVVREVLMQRWHESNALARRQRLKHVAYMSMEFLIARNLASALAATGLDSECRAALATLGVDLDEIVRHEQDPALGNGGLGRLAACFLDIIAAIAPIGWTPRMSSQSPMTCWSPARAMSPSTRFACGMPRLSSLSISPLSMPGVISTPPPSGSGLRR